MAKEQKIVDLDLKDRKILYELELDGRQPISSVAKKMRLSKQVVQYRINKLVERGVIEYFYTVIDSAKLGYIGFRVYIKLQDATIEREKEIFDYLVKSPQGWWIAEGIGNWDVVAMIWCKSIYDFENFWAEFLKKYKRNVGPKFISPFTTVYLYPRSYLLPGVPREPRAEVICKGPEVKTDEKDWDILKVIACNARMSSLDIGERVKLSPRLVSQRIKRMMKVGIIQGFRPVINYGKMGYSFYKVDMNLQDFSRYGELMTFARMSPNIVYIDKSVGGSDFEFDCEVQGVAEFRQLIDQIRAKFGDIIKDYDFYQATKIYKTMFLPGSIPPV